ncbi:hypothetical protein [Lutispora saccharofermentans]|uniref:Uncharacterized protein n=1 Tax=Lutispora saccharofermentans TaxID=3024236 RepID=A0ABT1NK22_9FIRM|nr:hypothetical protein [Lutispora saccharofermentans]MCQ1531615.1 hypothetical protein [Lutispora saccharofermentans]
MIRLIAIVCRNSETYIVISTYVSKMMEADDMSIKPEKVHYLKDCFQDKIPRWYSKYYV